MKKELILSFASAMLLLGACQDTGKGSVADQAAVVDSTGQATAVTAGTPGGRMPVNTQASVVEWTGTKPTGSFHAGTIKLSSGEVIVQDGAITGGKFTIDMNSINVTDLSGTDKTDLEGHLKDPDFFDTANHPTGTFEIGLVQPLQGDKNGSTHMFAGALTLKGKSIPIRLTAKVGFVGDKVVVETPEFVINRTDWGITYKSGIIGTLKDKMIDDFIKLKVKLETGI